MKDLKYLFAYTVPLAAWWSFESHGIWTFSAVFYAFIVIPFLDVITGEGDRNLSEDEAQYKKTKWIFDAMLYLNVPIVFGLLGLVLSNVHSEVYATHELVGLALSSGILLATNGINVAHELGHRAPYAERFLSKLLYLLCLYMQVMAKIVLNVKVHVKAGHVKQFGQETLGVGRAMPEFVSHIDAIRREQNSAR